MQSQLTPATAPGCAVRRWLRRHLLQPLRSLMPGALLLLLCGSGLAVTPPSADPVPASSARQPGAAHKSVLILSGSQYGLPVMDTLTAGAVSSLKERGISVNQIYVEHLDLVRSSDPQWRATLAGVLRDKLAQADIGLVIVQNQGALEFVAQEGYGIVPPDVPVLATLISNPTVAWHGMARRRRC